MGSARGAGLTTRWLRYAISLYARGVMSGLWRATSKPAWIHGHTAPLLIVAVGRGWFLGGGGRRAGLSFRRCGGGTRRARGRGSRARRGQVGRRGGRITGRYH